MKFYIFRLSGVFRKSNLSKLKSKFHKPEFGLLIRKHLFTRENSEVIEGHALEMEASLAKRENPATKSKAGEVQINFEAACVEATKLLMMI